MAGKENTDRRPMKNSVFWDLMPCRPVKVNRRFGGTSVSQGRNQYEVGNKQSFASLILVSWLTDIFPKIRSAFTGLHGVMTHKTEWPLL
jgi:hypothetical protein